jgi:hypothetical protein
MSLTHTDPVAIVPACSPSLAGTPSPADSPLRAALSGPGARLVEARGGRLVAVRRPFWFGQVSWFTVHGPAAWRHARRRGDHCRLHFHPSPAGASFLVLSFVESTRDCTLATFRIAVRALDEAARLRRADALVCDASNLRISDRLLRRWGWEPHAEHLPGRNWIKRFYGRYEAPLAPECFLP